MLLPHHAQIFNIYVYLKYTGSSKKIETFEITFTEKEKELA
jgi:hypothetical protein